MDWEQAWSITRQTVRYTNHTLLPEALERWPLGHVRPPAAAASWRSSTRSMRASSTRCAWRFFGDEERIARLSLIDEAGERYVRMAHLASVGSHAINGVAALHSELLKRTCCSDFAELWPEKFANKTNGVTPRRWMVLAIRGSRIASRSASATSWITRSQRTAQARAAGRGRGLPRRVAADQACQQDDARGGSSSSAPAWSSIRRRSSTCR